jgi:hypothetical protein
MHAGPRPQGSAKSDARRLHCRGHYPGRPCRLILPVCPPKHQWLGTRRVRSTGCRSKPNTLRWALHRRRLVRPQRAASVFCGVLRTPCALSCVVVPFDSYLRPFAAQRRVRRAPLRASRHSTRRRVHRPLGSWRDFISESFVSVQILGKGLPEGAEKGDRTKSVRHTCSLSVWLGQRMVLLLLADVQLSLPSGVLSGIYNHAGQPVRAGASLCGPLR